MIKDAQLAENAKMLVDGVEEAGVLAGNADRLAVEKLARYFMRQFKDTQLGKSGNGIKETVGTDLQVSAPCLAPYALLSRHSSNS